MTLLSPREDFVVRTLASFYGAWARLAYTAGLLQADGRYAHWGFIRTYGGEKAQATIAGAHREVFREVLRQPIQQIAAERSRHQDAPIVLHANYIPGQASKAAALHFNAVLFALAQLDSAKRPAA